MWTYIEERFLASSEAKKLRQMGSVATFEPTKNKNATFFSCTGNRALGRYCQALSTVSYSAEANPGTTRGGQALHAPP